MDLNILGLLVAFNLKHFFADFILQTDEMARGKFKKFPHFVNPLLKHCGVHALMTLLILLLTNPQLWWLALVDMGIHFLIDRSKVKLEKLSDNAHYKIGLFGLDQMAHHSTYFFLIFLIETL